MIKPLLDEPYWIDINEIVNDFFINLALYSQESVVPEFDNSRRESDEELIIYCLFRFHANLAENQNESKAWQEAFKMPDSRRGRIIEPMPIEDFDLEAIKKFIINEICMNELSNNYSAKASQDLALKYKETNDLGFLYQKCIDLIKKRVLTNKLKRERDDY